ncbi:hypothetical protein DdX_21829 [Ditylenchus destructor]|uniref:Tetratricopeptide repeat protein n=1 Tax=Ditylenchus destructor TaxID=166010 RepID=A0AAD4QSU5_9BILA|nr:hypothetical protein DdX_21829 [Ditylenchus destructor]
MARRRRAAPQRRRDAARLVQHRAPAARERRLPPRRAPHLPPARHRRPHPVAAARELPGLPRPGPPRLRLKPEDMARLARRFSRIRQFEDADRLCRILLKTAPDHPELADTLSTCANGLLHAGLRDKAMGLLPHLLRLAPNDMVTRALQNA